MPIARTLTIAWLFLVALGPAQPPPAFRNDDPTSNYEPRDILGFHLLVNHRLLEHPQEATLTLDEIESQLRKAVAVVPPGPLAELREVRIWVERAHVEGKAAEFHPSGRWLVENGYNPAKAGNIEIANAGRFVAWSRRDQPWALLHELAHAYHFRVLGERSPDVLEAYRQALAKGLYDRVKTARGDVREAYARSNPKEYFAELSEAYFGRNDFQPFTRDELKTFDPSGYRLMGKVWGEPIKPASP